MEEAEGSDDPAHSGDGVEVEEAEGSDDPVHSGDGVEEVVVVADNDVHEDNDDADVLQ